MTDGPNAATDAWSVAQQRIFDRALKVIDIVISRRIWNDGQMENVARCHNDIADDVEKRRVVTSAIRMTVRVWAKTASLVATGLCGNQSFRVNRRRAEIGIRIALGASRSQILRKIMVENLWVIGFELAARIPLTLVAILRLVPRCMRFLRLIPCIRVSHCCPSPGFNVRSSGAGAPRSLRRTHAVASGQSEGASRNREPKI